MEFQISGDSLAVLACVAVSASKDARDAGLALAAAHIVADSAGVTFTATDRFTLARIHGAAECADPGEVLLDSKDLVTAAKALSKESAVTVSADSERVVIRGRAQVFEFSPNRGQFPRLDGILPAHELNPGAHGVSRFNPDYLARLAKVKLPAAKNDSAANSWRVFVGAENKPWLWVRQSQGFTAEFLIMPMRTQAN